MSRRLFYLMSGPAHLPYLVVSLYTLRQHWQGPVTIYAFPESYPIARRIADDERLQGEGLEAVIYHRPYQWRRNNQFSMKILIAKGIEADSAVYLDADTSVHQPIDELFRRAESSGFCATQFCQWTTNHGIQRKRIKRLEQFTEEIPRELVVDLITNTWPALNGGVWACWPNSEVLTDWHEWTSAAKSIFIADEIALHVCMAKHEPRDQFDVLRGGAWNCSAREKLQPNELQDEDVVIRHYHGDSNLRPNKAKKGPAIWWPLYQECMELNIGGIVDWRSEIKNKYLSRYERG